MNKITIIECEWNCYNGFIFSLFDLELFKSVNMDSALFSINVSTRFLYMDILFLKIKFFDRNDSLSEEIY